MKKVYISSPYRLGNKEENVIESLRIANELIKLGLNPFCPLLSHFQNKYFPQEEETWLRIDFDWVKVCNILLRLPGKSEGADKEVKIAKENNIPVYYSLNELIEIEFNSMKWVKKYRIIKKMLIGSAKYLGYKNLGDFEFKEPLTEQDFLNGKELIIIDEKNPCGCWYIGHKIVEKDLKEIRKIKLKYINKK